MVNIRGLKPEIKIITINKKNYRQDGEYQNYFVDKKIFYSDIFYDRVTTTISLLR